MKSNQRSQENNQSDNGGNELPVSSSRAGTVERDNMNPAGLQRGGVQTGSAQNAEPGMHEPNDAAGGLPMSPGGANELAADQKMDDDTGLSNTANRRSADTIDDGSRQEAQSNVGRRSDGTPD